MAKSKKIISAILSAAICTGVICAATASAQPAETSVEIEKPIPEITETVDVAAPAADQTFEQALDAAITGKDFSIDKVVDVYEKFGTTVYPMSAPISSELLNEPEKLANSFFPTRYKELPYTSTFGELSTGKSVATSYLFNLKNSTNVYIKNTINVLGNNDQLATVRVTLYKSRKGTQTWQRADSQDVQTTGGVSVYTTFTELDQNFEYCMVFENASDFDCVVSGVFNITDIKP